MIERYRAIIIKDNNILLMRRCIENREFYVFPGGKLEENETPTQCCERELAEEFGIKVKVKKMIYLTHQLESKQGFFLCDWVSGKIHKTDAVEYTGKDNAHFGTYEPTTVPLTQIPDITLYPCEVAQHLNEDLQKFGTELQRPLIEFECVFKK